MTKEKIAKKKESKEKGITFQCKFCEKFKALEEMILLTRFSPPLVACRACEKRMS
ncbi:MAG: hypothetical protein HY528_04710 [Chloroflexi bacterium]|nr:hypothetical protein [Chloroflexota bacterium]